MNVYKGKGQKYYRIALMLTDTETGARKQYVISTGQTNKRFAAKIKDKIDLLVSHAETGLPLTSELRTWLDGVNPKIRKRLDQLGLIPSEVMLQITEIYDHVEDYLRACAFQGHGGDYIRGF